MLCHKVALFLVLVGTALGSWPGSPKPIKRYYNLKDAEQHFADFINNYERKYESAEEYNQRFNIFKRKLVMINYWNAVHEASFDITEFADKDHSEHNFGFVPSKLRHDNSVHVKEEWLKHAPERLDYRKQGLVTPVKTQQCGDCYIFSAVENVESQYAKLTGKLISLSEQQALDCVGNHPCNVGGDEGVIIQKLADTEGLMTEADYPYKGIDEKCTHDKNKVKVKVTAGIHLNITDEESLKGALAEHGPLTIALFASTSWMSYAGGEVFKPTDCGNNSPNHALLLVGYDTDQKGTPYWIIKNSWGTNWGAEGYLLLERGKGHCGILQEGNSYAKVTSP